MSCAPTVKPEIESLERVLLKRPQITDRLRLKHHFGPGVYVRELWRPRWAIIIGHAHKTRHLNILVSGHLKVYMDGKVHDIRAGDVFVSEAGVRKITRAIKESTLMTIHPTNETDLDKLEEELVVKSGAYIEHENRMALEALGIALTQ